MPRESFEVVVFLIYISVGRDQAADRPGQMSVAGVELELIEGNADIMLFGDFQKFDSRRKLRWLVA